MHFFYSNIGDAELAFQDFGDHTPTGAVVWCHYLFGYLAGITVCRALWHNGERGAEATRIVEAAVKPQLVLQAVLKGALQWRRGPMTMRVSRVAQALVAKDWWGSGDGWNGRSWNCRNGHDEGWTSGTWTDSGWQRRRDSNVSYVEETTLVHDGKWQGPVSSGTGSTRGEAAVGDDGPRQAGRSGEKLVIPEFSGEGSEAELGKSARSYLRKVAAWLKCARMPERERPVALYTHLTGKAWIFAEELDVDQLAEEGGINYFQQWIRVTRHVESAALATQNDMGGLQSVAPAATNATHLLKTWQKYCACHTKRLLTRHETCWNVTKCHACHAK